MTGFWLGRKSKYSEIARLNARLNNSIEHQKYQVAQLSEQAQAAMQKLRMEQVDKQTRLEKSDMTIDNLKSELLATRGRERKLKEINSKLHAFYTMTLENLRNEGAVLPSAVRWANNLREFLDQIIVKQLALPPHPAPSAAIQVKEARRLARQW